MKTIAIDDSGPEQFCQLVIRSSAAVITELGKIRAGSPDTSSGCLGDIPSYPGKKADSISYRLQA